MQVSEALFPSKTTQIQNRYSATPAALPAAPQFLVRRSCHRGALATTPGSPVSRHSQSSRLWGRSRHAASTPSPFGRIRPRPLALKHQSVPTFSVEGSVTNRPTPVAVPSPIQHMHNIQKLQPPRRQEHVLRKRNSRVKWSRKNALAPKPSPGCRLSAQISARYKDLVLTMMSVRGGNEGSSSRNGRRHQGCFSPAGDRQLTKKEDGCNVLVILRCFLWALRRMHGLSSFIATRRHSADGRSSPSRRSPLSTLDDALYWTEQPAPAALDIISAMFSDSIPPRTSGRSDDLGNGIEILMRYFSLSSRYICVASIMDWTDGRTGQHLMASRYTARLSLLLMKCSTYICSAR